MNLALDPSCPIDLEVVVVLEDATNLTVGLLRVAHLFANLLEQDIYLYCEHLTSFISKFLL